MKEEELKKEIVKMKEIEAEEKKMMMMRKKELEQSKRNR